MDLRRMIKLKAVEKGINTDSEIARRVGWARANYTERLKRNSWKVTDLEKIAEALDCELIVEFKDKE